MITVLSRRRGRDVVAVNAKIAITLISTVLCATVWWRISEKPNRAGTWSHSSTRIHRWRWAHISSGSVLPFGR